MNLTDLVNYLESARAHALEFEAVKKVTHSNARVRNVETENRVGEIEQVIERLINEQLSKKKENDGAGDGCGGQGHTEDRYGWACCLGSLYI